MGERVAKTVGADPWTLLGRRALALAREMARGSEEARELESGPGSGEGELSRLLGLVRDLEIAEERVLVARQEVERFEARLDGAAVHAGETLISLTNALAELTGSQERLAKGGVADDPALEDIDFQVSSLKRRVAEIKARQDAQSRDIELEMSPQRDRLVEAELERQEATRRLVDLLQELRPDPCPEELGDVFDELVRLRRGL